MARGRRRGQILPRGKDCWLVRVSLKRDTATGQRRRLAKLVHGTKAEAERCLTGLLREADLGRGPVVAGASTGFRAYLVDTITAHHQLAPQTKSKALAAVNGIPDWLGNLPLRDLTAGHLDAYYNALLEAGKSRTTVAYLHRIIRARLTEAVERNLRLDNPATVANAPSQPKGETTALTSAEAARVTAVCRDHPWGALWLLMLTTGLRGEELLGLQWADLDDRRLQVRRALIRVKGRWEFGPTKTRRSRAVVVPVFVDDLLRRHKARQNAERLRLGPHYRTDLDLVFAGPGGVPLWWSTVSTGFRRGILPAAGITRRIRPYDLRHTAATLLLVMGEHPKVVSEMLGHGSVAITLDTYSHVAPNLLERVADRFDALLEPGPVQATGTDAKIGTPTGTPARG